MNITISRPSLLSALNSVAVALSSKCANPYGSFTLLTVKGDSLTLVADSIQLRAEASVKCQSKADGVALISHSKLVALLQRADSDVSLVIEENRLQVKVGSSVTNLPLMPADGFPKSRDDGDQKAFVILDNQAFANSLAVVCPFAGDGLSHIWNTDLLIEDDATKLILCAADGKRMARIALPTSGNKFRTSVPAKSVRAVANLIASSESLTMTVYEKSTRFDMEGVSIQIQQSAVTFPENITKICDGLRDSLTDFITLSRSTLISELQTAADMLERDEDGVRMEIKADAKALVITSCSKSTADHESRIDVKVKTALPRRRMNHGYVISMLRALDCDDVTLNYEPEFKQPAFRISPTGVDAIETYCVFLKDL